MAKQLTLAEKAVTCYEARAVIDLAADSDDVMLVVEALGLSALSALNEKTACLLRARAKLPINAARYCKVITLHHVKGLLLMSTAILATSLTFAMNWFALIPWRRAKAQHWTERARLFYPVRIAAVSNLWVLPADLCMTVNY